MGPPDKRKAPTGQAAPIASKEDQKPSSFSTFDSSAAHDRQEVLTLDQLDELIEASKDCERAIARRGHLQRRMTLNLICYREALEDFGRALWIGAT